MYIICIYKNPSNKSLFFPLIILLSLFQINFVKLNDKSDQLLGVKECCLKRIYKKVPIHLQSEEFLILPQVGIMCCV